MTTRPPLLPQLSSPRVPRLRRVALTFSPAVVQFVQAQTSILPARVNRANLLPTELEAETRALGRRSGRTAVAGVLRVGSIFSIAAAFLGATPPQTRRMKRSSSWTCVSEADADWRA